MKASRIIEMEKYILEKGTASMEELIQVFGVSANTVRRDIAQLILKGTVDKVYGGVCSHQKSALLTPYDERRISAEEPKGLIGAAASALVTDGDIIFIDSGTTTLRMIQGLRDKKNVTIITNNLDAIVQAVPFENLHVIVLPGSLRRKTNSFTGGDAVKYLKKYNISKAFMAATGLSVHGATNSSAQEYEIKQAAVENSEVVCLLVDSRKFGVTGMLTFARMDDFDMVVTDQIPSREYSELLENAGVHLIVAGKDEKEEIEE